MAIDISIRYDLGEVNASLDSAVQDIRRALDEEPNAEAYPRLKTDVRNIARALDRATRWLTQVNEKLAHVEDAPTP